MRYDNLNQNRLEYIHVGFWERAMDGGKKKTLMDCLRGSMMITDRSRVILSFDPKTPADRSATHSLKQ
jgi:hypothetical protein